MTAALKLQDGAVREMLESSFFSTPPLMDGQILYWHSTKGTCEPLNIISNILIYFPSCSYFSRRAPQFAQNGKNLCLRITDLFRTCRFTTPLIPFSRMKKNSFNANDLLFDAMKTEGLPHLTQNWNIAEQHYFILQPNSRKDVEGSIMQIICFY